MRKLLLGLMVVALLSVSAVVYAEEMKSLVGQAIQGTFPVTVNGENLKNEAIVLDGTAYLPVRELSEKLGVEVEFSLETGISLNKPEAINKEDVETKVEEKDSTGFPISYWTEASVSNAIEAQKRIVEVNETALKIFSDASAEDKQKMLEGLQKAKDRLSELEQIKENLTKQAPK